MPQAQTQIPEPPDFSASIHPSIHPINHFISNLSSIRIITHLTSLTHPLNWFQITTPLSDPTNQPTNQPKKKKNKRNKMPTQPSSTPKPRVNMDPHHRQPQQTSIPPRGRPAGARAGAIKDIRQTKEYKVAARRYVTLCLLLLSLFYCYHLFISFYVGIHH